jgi:hypothetical protein
MDNSQKYNICLDSYSRVVGSNIDQDINYLH